MIKKITYLLIASLLVLTSCTTDIEVNNPALQAKIDGEVFVSSIKKAVLYDDGTLVITGSHNGKTISFTTTSEKVGSYKTSQQTISKISFEQNQTKFVSKNDESDGTVTITEIYDNEITGNFYFDDLKDDDGNTISFKDGWFYRLPIENGFIEDETENEEDQNISNPCLLNASLTALVNGSEMITDDHSAVLNELNDVYSIRINAANETDEISIVFLSNVTPGTYDLSGSGSFSASHSLNNDKSSALSGTLTITEHNIDSKCISGTFNFETRGGNQITNGSFDFGY
ncbi:DUF6252 family protein [Aquimarina pacifica]|uniref:DUF6252 family protein n=1 Tax=Aquimarina pacifica TaxID=1296415 RepID=UPI0004702B8B|nr:DUF6252 family protein [Aquimarina pacifica]